MAVRTSSLIDIQERYQIYCFNVFWEFLQILGLDDLWFDLYGRAIKFAGKLQHVDRPARTRPLGKF